jgi:hypothetical protein
MTRRGARRVKTSVPALTSRCASSEVLGSTRVAFVSAEVEHRADPRGHHQGDDKETRNDDSAQVPGTREHNNQGARNNPDQRPVHQPTRA